MRWPVQASILLMTFATSFDGGIASAAAVRYEFNGVMVNDPYGSAPVDLPTDIVPDQAFSGSLTVVDTVPDADPDPSHGVYIGLATALDLVIGDLNFTLADPSAGRAVVIDDGTFVNTPPSSFLFDHFRVEVDLAGVDAPPGYTWRGALFVTRLAGTALTADSFPEDLPSFVGPSTYDNLTLLIGLSNFNTLDLGPFEMSTDANSRMERGLLTSMVMTAVPLPAAAWLITPAVGLLIPWVKRR